MLIGLMNKSLAIYGILSSSSTSVKKMMADRRDGFYDTGKALSEAFREEIIELWNQGFSANEILGDLKVTVRGVMLIDRGQQRSIDRSNW